MDPLQKKLNEKLIKKVLTHIRGDLRRYDQDIVCVTKEAVEQDTLCNEGDLKNPTFASCGTKACFGGWAYLLSHSRRQWKRLINRSLRHDFPMLDRARDLLGLYPNEADFLFDSTHESPSTDLRIIQNRLHDIRLSREIENAARAGATDETLNRMREKLKCGDEFFDDYEDER